MIREEVERLQKQAIGASAANQRFLEKHGSALLKTGDYAGGIDVSA